MPTRWRFSGSRRAFLARVGAAAALLALDSLAAACGAGGTSGPSPSTGPSTVASPGPASGASKAAIAASGGKTLVFADTFEPKSYSDPGAGIFMIREGIGQGLVQVGFDSAFEPALATEWTPVDDTTWHIKLRSGVRFHNGSTLDAEAVKFSLERLAKAKEAPRAFQGATVAAEGTGAVRITTTGPVPFMPAILADGVAVILERTSYGPDGKVSQPIGTGPFMLADFRPGDRRVLQAFAGYWGGRPKLAEVQYLYVPQAQTRANMVRTGEADVARVVSPADVPALKGTPNVQVRSVSLPRVRALYPNLRKAPTSDLKVRQALAHLVDREAVVHGALEGQGAPQAALFRPDYPWGNPAMKGLPLDVERAKALLTAAGYGASKPLTLTLLSYSSRPELPAVAQVLQQQFAKAGVKCQISIQDSTVVESAALKGEHDLVLLARNPLFLFDPQATFETDYASSGSYNLCRYGALDEAIKSAGTITDQARRYDQYRQMEKRIIEDDVATIVITSYLQLDAVRGKVAGYRPHPTDAIALTEQIDKA